VHQVVDINKEIYWDARSAKYKKKGFYKVNCRLYWVYVFSLPILWSYEMRKETFHFGWVHQFVRPSAVGGVCFCCIRASFEKKKCNFTRWRCNVKVTRYIVNIW